jgi:acyl carrier protein
MDDKLDKIKNIIAEQLGVSEDEIQEDSNLVEDLDADSLDIVELVMAFEDEFGVKVPDDQLEHIKTVGDILKILEA